MADTIEELVQYWNAYFTNPDIIQKKIEIMQRGFEDFVIVGTNIPTGFEGMNGFITKAFNTLIEVGLYPKKLEYIFNSPDKHTFRFSI